MATTTSSISFDRIRTHLDQRVYGQNAARDALAASAFLHASGVSPSPVLLVGPTGTGKTLLARTLAEALALPFCAIDASQIVPDGYVGSSVSSRLALLLQACEESSGYLRGLVFVDELDKLGRTGEKRFRDQAAAGLLALLNGDPVALRDSSMASANRRTDTLMVVAAGAFQGVREEVHKSCRAIGFRPESDDQGDVRGAERSTRQPITLADIREHGGLQPELVARFRQIAVLKPPTCNDLAKAARRVGELHALVQSVRKRHKVRLIFGASWFRRWATHAAEDSESSYRALHGSFQPVALHLVRALAARSARRTVSPLLLTADTFDALLASLPTNEWLRAQFAESARRLEGKASVPRGQLVLPDRLPS